MILPDLNLLLHAYNRHVAQHARAKQWWESVLNGRELIGLPLEVTLGFVRIATNSRMGAAAVSLAAARGVVDSWSESLVVRVLIQSEDHSAKVLDLLERSEASGLLTSDAFLAVYAIEARAKLCANDSDFARFPRLQWENPLL